MREARRRMRRESYRGRLERPCEKVRQLPDPSPSMTTQS